MAFTPSKMGATTRAAPSSSDSGGSGLEAESGFPGRIIDTQPGSTAVQYTPKVANSGAAVLVSIFSAAFAMLVCGCSDVFAQEPSTEKTPSAEVTLTTYRELQPVAPSWRRTGRRPWNNMKGAAGFTAKTSDNSRPAMSPLLSVDVHVVDG